MFFLHVSILVVLAKSTKSANLFEVSLNTYASFIVLFGWCYSQKQYIKNDSRNLVKVAFVVEYSNPSTF